MSSTACFKERAESNGEFTKALNVYWTSLKLNQSAKRRDSPLYTFLINSLGNLLNRKTKNEEFWACLHQRKVSIHVLWRKHEVKFPKGQNPSLTNLVVYGVLFSFPFLNFNAKYLLSWKILDYDVDSPNKAPMLSEHPQTWSKILKSTGPAEFRENLLLQAAHILYDRSESFWEQNIVHRCCSKNTGTKKLSYDLKSFLGVLQLSVFLLGPAA